MNGTGVLYPPEVPSIMLVSLTLRFFTSSIDEGIYEALFALLLAPEVLVVGVSRT
jgi:hypothetical protein